MPSRTSSSKVQPCASQDDSDVAVYQNGVCQNEVCQNEVCQHIDARGHRCRMLVTGPNENLCPHHKQRLLATRRGRESATAEFVACLKDHFGDTESVHGFLCSVLKQMTLKHISRRDAVTLTYVCRAILSSNAEGCREALFERQEQRLQALAAAQRPRKVIWDLPHPAYEPDDPVEPDPPKKS